MPGVRKGIPSPKAGRTFPNELLTPREIDVLLATPAKDVTFDARDKAMIWLMYRSDLKLFQVVRLLRSDWNPETGILKIPPGKAIPGRAVRVDSRGRELLEDWIEFRRHLANVRVTTPLFCQIQSPATGRDVAPSAWRKSLEIRTRKAGIEKRVNPEALRESGRLHAQRRTLLIGTQFEAYIDDYDFRGRHPEAHDRWQAAIELFGANADRHAVRIAQDCRASLEALASDFELDQDADASPDVDFNDRLTRVIERDRRSSPTVRKALKALVAQVDYSLGNFENHADQGRHAQRVIYQTMTVLYEIDRSLTSEAGLRTSANATRRDEPKSPRNGEPGKPPVTGDFPDTTNNT
jgi:hypothetical protein